jgi:uncharacterized protein (TIGR02145 family)
MTHKLLLLLFLFSLNHITNSQEFKTVKIGQQEWMAENLNIKTAESRCYKNDIENCKVFGRLYGWNKASHVCPEGFRLPTDEDWKILVDSLGGLDIAGNKLKMGGDSGFNVLMGGNYNFKSDIFSFQYRNAYYWTATEFNESTGWMRQFSIDQSNINRSTVKKHYYFSVRCIKN